MAVANAVAMASMTAVAATMAKASDSCFEEFWSITASTAAVKVAAR